MKTLIVLLILFTASTAFGCPQCALNTRAGLGSWFILSGMITFPFVVVGVTFYTLRKMAIFATEQENLDEAS